MAGLGRAVKQEQEEISPNHVQASVHGPLFEVFGFVGGERGSDWGEEMGTFESSDMSESFIFWILQQCSFQHIVITLSFSISISREVSSLQSSIYLWPLAQTIQTLLILGEERTCRRFNIISKQRRFPLSPHQTAVLYAEAWISFWHAVCAATAPVDFASWARRREMMVCVS